MNLKKVLLATLIGTISVSAYAAGGFFAKNTTNHTVTIRVGNIIPETIVISPHSSRYVTVSTNNQNIEISNIS